VLFAREGARVVVSDRDEAAARETCELISSEGGAAIAIRADVTSDADCRATVDACLDEYGQVDVLHNNVGIGSGDAGATSIEEEALDRLFDVNLKGPWRMVRHTLPAMRERRSGSIINVSSIAAICAAPMFGYKITKSALNSMTHALAMGNAEHGIRVNAIMPGLINTPMAIEGISKALGIDKRKLVDARDAQVPLGHKMGTAWDVAHAALFLASDESRFVTGVLLPVDGGQSARVG
jgi:NAD(P)-dependent dehydrogenase (short-subunit alcohol dehydrogenase family)